MTVHETLMDQTVQETITNPESHQFLHWDRPGHPDHDFEREDRMYLSLSIAVVVVALLTVIGILICFCRPRKGTYFIQKCPEPIILLVIYLSKCGGNNSIRVRSTSVIQMAIKLGLITTNPIYSDSTTKSNPLICQKNIAFYAT